MVEKFGVLTVDWACESTFPKPTKRNRKIERQIGFIEFMGVYVRILPIRRVGITMITFSWRANARITLASRFRSVPCRIPWIYRYCHHEANGNFGPAIGNQIKFNDLDLAAIH